MRKGQQIRLIGAIMTSMILVVGTMTLVLPYQEALAATEVTDCDVDASFAGERMVMTADFMNLAFTCLQIDFDGVTLDCRGHTIDGTDDGASTAISVTGNGVTVKNCNITDYAIGISVSGSDGSKITRNTLTSGANGIILSNGAMNNKVTANTVSGHTIRALLITSASFNQIDRNDFSDNSLGGSLGISLANADNNSFSGNNIDRSRNENIRLASGSEDNVFKRNTTNGSLFGDGVSITDAGSTGNIFTGNTSNDNALFGIDDDTTGGTGVGVTDTFYTRNSCSGNTSGNSDPAGLCG